MSTQKVWFVTGASRGLGADIAKAALAAGHHVVATARNPTAATDALGASDELLVVALDVTGPSQAEAAVRAAEDRFGRIDVVVNNAGYGQLGFFEELSSAQIERQFATNVFGAMNVTRAVLPGMRARRSGHIISISSVSGLLGSAGATAYTGSKFAVEGWMESLYLELEPFGIRTTVVEPGFFRTDFLEGSSVAYGERTIDDYAEQSAAFRAWHENKSHQQEGDPAKLAAALLTLTDADEPPVRFIAGADAVAVYEGELERRRQQIDAWRDLSTSLAHDDPTGAAR